MVNHHLLMSDVAVRRAAGNWADTAVIPSWNRLIVDEGHHLEDAAAAHLGASGTRRGLQRLMSRLARTAGSGEDEHPQRGLLAALEESLRAKGGEMFSSASLDLLNERVLPAVKAVREKGGFVFDLMETFLRETGQTTVRLTDDFATHRVWRAGLTASLTDFVREAAALTDSIGMIRQRMEGETEQDEVERDARQRAARRGKKNRSARDCSARRARSGA